MSQPPNTELRLRNQCRAMLAMAKYLGQTSCNSYNLQTFALEISYKGVRSHHKTHSKSNRFAMPRHRGSSTHTKGEGNQL